MLEIWADNHVEARWFQGLDSRLSRAEVRIIGRRGANPKAVEDLIHYDRPDIILLEDGVPRLVLEKTREVPTGHNVGQRVARIVRAVELQVPTIKFFPFDAMKHGTYANLCRLNIRLLQAFSRMTEIHEVPVLAVNWPDDGFGELRVDGNEDLALQEVVRDHLDHSLARWWPAAERAIDNMRDEYRARLGIREQYSSPPPSVARGATSEVLGRLSGWEALASRAETVLYTIGMRPPSCRRQDPYTGTQFIYDYAECRSGPDVAQKHRNLVLHFPNLSAQQFAAANPNDSDRKSSNWYLTANAFLFRDGLQVLRRSHD